MRLALNVLNYQAIWLLCVLGGNRMAWLGLVLIGAHLLWSHQRRSDLILIVIWAGGGMVLDGVLKLLGLFSFRGDAFPIPLWLIVIWMALATLPNHSLGWLQRKPLWAALLGAIGGPLAYWAGVRLDAATFHWPLLPTLVTLMAVWGIVTPLMMQTSVLLTRR